ncbi:MAG: UDP-N-acetylglucosamine 2-epimerase (non-hydrolyzing) [candidate division Zixibacteria bacterium]|nr:UDP-N-acetylglucosamine 2-epimerase (non-hydrolyzing) [candidate division Zixibacteria bacterium]
MRIVSVVGARPQLIKLAALHRELNRFDIDHQVINTGQHYDRNLAGVFFDELKLPEPRYDLGVGSAATGEMVAKILAGSARALRKLAPDLVVVYGDTNSTLGGALAAAQLGYKLAHVEAGLRCFDLSIPEELNRVVTDRIADIHFCPTPQAKLNLKKEGIIRRVYQTGDILYDVMQSVLPSKKEMTSQVARFGLEVGRYLLVTLHRSDSVDDRDKLRRLVSLLASLREQVFFPIHPRTRKRLRQFDLMSRLKQRANIKIVPPCGYRESLSLVASARMVLTDSGGIQREAYRLRVPTLLLREVTEWVEILKARGSMIVGFDRDKLKYGLYRRRFCFTDRLLCRSGAANRIAKLLRQLV